MYFYYIGRRGPILKEKRQRMIEKMEAFRFYPITDELFACYKAFEALIEGGKQPAAQGRPPVAWVLPGGNVLSPRKVPESIKVLK
jgi:hypothetical protein